MLIFGTAHIGVFLILSQNSQTFPLFYLFHKTASCMYFQQKSKLLKIKVKTYFSTR